MAVAAPGRKVGKAGRSKLALGSCFRPGPEMAILGATSLLYRPFQPRRPHPAPFEARRTPWWLFAVISHWLAGFAPGMHAAEPFVHDDFRPAPPPSRSIATRPEPSSVPRQVIDPAGLIRASKDGFRLLPPATNAWGQLGVVYGPFTTEPGLGVGWRLRLGDVDRWDPVSPIKLTCGWFPTRNPLDPVTNGVGFVLQPSADGMGGMLGMIGPAGVAPLVSPVGQLDIQLFAFFRTDTVLFYASGSPGVPGIGVAPWMRPIGLANRPAWSDAYAGLHQQNQRDPEHPTFLEGVRVAVVPSLAGWAGGATISVIAPFGPSASTSPKPPANLAEEPVSGPGDVRVFMVEAASPAGLVSAVIETDATPGNAAILWRWKDKGNHWRAEINHGEARLVRVLGGKAGVLATDPEWRAKPGSSHRYWLTDDGQLVQLWRDDRPILWAVDGSLATETQVGIDLGGAPGSRAHHFEAHPRQMPIPPLFELGQPFQRLGTNVVFADQFEGESGHLAGRRPPHGALPWQRHGGPDADGEFIVLDAGHGPRVVRENAEFLRYLVEWSKPNFADIACDLTPPAPPRECHAGVVLWQDDRNFIQSFWDSAEGRHGVWCVRDGHWVPNEVSHVRTGPQGAHRVRLASDGDNYQFLVDGRPVIVGRLSDAFPGFPPLAISKTGIGVGKRGGRGDGGTFFGRFEARR